MSAAGSGKRQCRQLHAHSLAAHSISPSQTSVGIPNLESPEEWIHLCWMGLDEHIRKTVGRPKFANPLRELQALNDSLRSLGVPIPEPDTQNVRKTVGRLRPKRD